MSRMELIDIIFQLCQEKDELEHKLSESSKRLEEKRIVLKNSGSIADAALTLNGVFDAAQKAADQYLLSVKSAYANMEKQIQETKQQCEQMISEAKEEAERIKVRAAKESADRLDEANQECKRKYAQFQTRVNQYIKTHPDIRPMFTRSQK